MNSVENFFTAVVYPAPKGPLDSLREGVDDYFFLAGRKAYLLPGTSDANLRPAESSLAINAIKILSYATVVIPLIMLLLKGILRTNHTFTIVDEQNRDRHQLRVNRVVQGAIIQEEPHVLVKRIDEEENELIRNALEDTINDTKREVNQNNIVHQFQVDYERPPPSFLIIDEPVRSEFITPQRGEKRNSVREGAEAIAQMQLPQEWTHIIQALVTQTSINGPGLVFKNKFNKIIDPERWEPKAEVRDTTIQITINRRENTIESLDVQVNIGASLNPYQSEEVFARYRLTHTFHLTKDSDPDHTVHISNSVVNLT